MARPSKPDSVTFSASFPPIQTALRVSGTGDGARILLDIPETEMAAVLRLMTMRERVLRVTVEAE